LLDVILNTPGWVAEFVAVVLLTFAALAVAIVWERVGPKPLRTVELPDMTVELWVRERRFPCAADAVVVPVAPDLKMASGIAKLVRDATAGVIQPEADRVAPLSTGEAFAGSGGKHRFGMAVLAVVMDGQKRTSPDWIAAGVRRAIEVAWAQEAGSILIPDMTDDLLQQPEWIGEEERRAACRPIARAMLDGILSSGGKIENVKLWVWRKGSEDIWLEELGRMAEVQTVQAAA